MVDRSITLSKSNSFFVFGARGTGKSTLLKARYGSSRCLYIDLLDLATEDRFRTRPEELREEIAARQPEWVVIDEIQKLPRLLDMVHQLIEERRGRFILSGSSARKLKRGAANLLAGRAFVYHLHPLTFLELGSRFSLSHALEWGSLPRLLELQSSDDKAEFLRAYALTYLKEEIQLEQIVRRLDPFRNFLAIAAQANSEIVNYARIARDVGVDTTTAQNYFSILEDTLVGFLLPAHHHSVRKRQRENPKFYFFDTGVTRALAGTLQSKLTPQTYAYGKAFEHLVILEIRRLADYARRDWRFSYLRTKDGAEIDLIVERPGQRSVCIEIKSSSHITPDLLRTFIPLSRDLPNSEAWCLSQDPHEKKVENVTCLPWEEGIRRLIG